MFGVLRIVFALMVMSCHLYAGGLPMGTYALFGFFIISGYLMTLVMHESYGFTWVGRCSFAVNRFLRLYPQYWVASLFSMGLIFVFGGEVVVGYHPAIYVPGSVMEGLQNLLMAFWAWTPGAILPRLVPPTWALTVEMFFYILIALGASATFGRVKVWMLLSVCYVIFSFVAELPFLQYRYGHIAAASLPFSIGGAIYFISVDSGRRELFDKVRLSSRWLFFLMLANCAVWVGLSELNVAISMEIGFYLNILICFFLVYGLASGDGIFKVSKGMDKVVGDLSYPIYLLHWQSGFLVSYLLFGQAFREVSVRGSVSFTVTLIFVFVVSFVLVLLVDTPIQRVRARVKVNKVLLRSVVPRATELSR